MIIQPRGYKRKKLYTAAAIEVADLIEAIAEVVDCSRSIVTITILAEQLGVTLEGTQYELVKAGIAEVGRTGKVRRNKSGKRLSIRLPRVPTGTSTRYH